MGPADLGQHSYKQDNERQNGIDPQQPPITNFTQLILSSPFHDFISTLFYLYLQNAYQVYIKFYP